MTMVADKPTDDMASKLYAEWVSAGVKLSVAGFAATAKLMETTTQALVASKQKVKPTEASVARKQENPKPASKPAPAARAATNAEPAPQAKAAQHDDLKLINGIGPKLEQILVRKGVTSLAHIASWSASQMQSFDTSLGLGGRVAQDDWIGQAKRLIEERAGN
jgi:NADH-quinone oxidoreductase subunit E